MPPIHGIDISNHQGVTLDRLGRPLRLVVDWAKNAGIDLVCFKISEGRSSGDGRYEDGKRYVNTWRSVAQEVGFPYTGVYHWLSNDIPAEAQRDNSARRIGQLYANECIQLDIEEAGLSADEVRHAVDVWEETWPGRVFYYMGRYFDANLIDSLGIPPEKWWWPAYVPPASVEEMAARHHTRFLPGIWQWGGGGQGIYCDPVQSRIDSNQVLDWASLQARCGGSQNQPTRPITPLPTNLEEPVWTVCYLEGSPHIYIGLAARSTNGTVHVPYLIWLPNIDVVNDYLNTGAPSQIIPRASFHDVQANFVPDESLNGLLARIG